MAHLGKEPSGHLSKTASGHLVRCAVCGVSIAMCDDLTTVISGASGCLVDINGTYVMWKNADIQWIGARRTGPSSTWVVMTLECLNSRWELNVFKSSTYDLQARYVAPVQQCPPTGVYALDTCNCTGCGTATISVTP